MAIIVPLINGNRPDSSSYEVRVDGDIYLGIKALTYEDSLTPVKVRGVLPQAVGRTRGIYDGTASLEMYVDEVQQLIEKLAGRTPNGTAGYGEIAFDISVSIWEPPSAPKYDLIQGCRITKVGDELPGQSGEPASRKLDLDIMLISRNGRVIFRNGSR